MAQQVRLARNQEVEQMIRRLEPTIKRERYIRYDKYPKQIHLILEILKKRRRGDIARIASITGFPSRTLYNWANQLDSDSDFDPTKTHYGEHRRIFTDYEEDSISDYIIENIILPGILFTDADFRDLILFAFNEKYRNADLAQIPKFGASNGYIYDFKRNHNLCSRRCHFKRRPSGKEYDEDFIKEMDWLFKNVDHKYIVNADETGWEVVPGNIKVWHIIGQDHVVRYVNANEKDKITVIGAITADGAKLPLQFIAKGETEAVLDSQIGDVGYHMRTFSSNGWTTAETFQQFLVGVRDYYTWDDPNTVHLLIDIFKAHTTDEVKALAETLNIHLHFIPAGLTDELQPLDIKIFGPMKTFARTLFRNRYKEDPYKKRTKIEACQDMVRAWERLTPEIIKEAFEHFEEIETWGVSPSRSTPKRVNLNRHHRCYVTANPEEKARMDQTEEYRKY